MEIHKCAFCSKGASMLTAHPSVAVWRCTDHQYEPYVLTCPSCAAKDAELAAWKDSAEQFYRNEDYYRGLVVAIGETFGIEAKTSDDGSVQEDVLCAKVPELVAALRAEVAILRDMLDAAVERQCKCGED